MATVTDITTIDYSGDLRADSLLQLGPGWNYLLPARNTLYYTFDLAVITSKASGPVSTFNAAQKSAVASILSYVTSITGIGFSEVASASSADLHFGDTNLSGGSTSGLTQTQWSYSSSGGGTLTAYSADAYVFLDNAEWGAQNAAPTAGSTGYETLLHEIGHALGLGHPFDDPYPLPAAEDNTNDTVMSYTHAGAIKSTFQSYDLLALRWLYGEDGLRGTWGLNSTNGPSLTLSGPPPPTDDYAASSSTTGGVAAGGSATGSVETAGDRDWFAVNVVAGTQYVFELKGSPTGDGTLADPSLKLLTSGGSTIASNNDSGGSANSRIEWTASSTGTFYLEAASGGASGTGTYKLSVAQLATNHAPQPQADTYTTSEDTPFTGNVLGNDSDPDGQALTASIVSSPAHGSMTLLPGGGFSYTPAANWFGADSFTYRASDGSLGANATVSITVFAANDRPVAFDLSTSTSEGSAKSGTLPTATDVDGDALTYSKATNPSHGSASVTSAGQYTYTPSAGYAGSDSFTYSVSDGVLAATATVTLTVFAVNHAPVAFDLSTSLAEDAVKSGALPAAADPDGNPLTYAKASSPAHGSASVGSAGQYTYTPAADYYGTDSFTYSVTDGLLTTVATVQLAIAPVNDAPRAAAASIATDEDTTANGTLPSASDADGDAVTYAKASNPAHGSVTVTPAGQYAYSPAADWNGTDAFDFRVSDPAGAGNTYTVSVTVRAVVDELTGTPGSDVLVDASGPARLSGLGGDDRLQGGSGDDTVSGGDGFDTAAYGDFASGYRVAHVGTGWRVTDKDGGEGVDTLAGIERLQFADKTFELVARASGAAPGYGVDDHFLFDTAYYLLENAELVPTVSPSIAWTHYASTGAAQGRAPASWFDATYYETKWPDLGALHLDDATLFEHFNLFGVWEGRSPGPAFDRFDGNAYLAQYPDVAAYVDAHVADFLGSRSNGAIAHFILYGAAEGRGAVDLVGQPIRLDYEIDLGA
ncbi:MAG: Ig-like domain-containing protein [Burkholderiaceae bacterium]